MARSRIAPIREKWEAEIVARDALTYMCLVSQLANMMYPEMHYARDRETRLMSEGGEFMQRIAAEASRRYGVCSSALNEWRRSNGEAFLVSTEQEEAA